MYRLLNDTVKGADLTPISFFEAFRTAQLRGRYLESNWIKMFPLADGKIEIHLPIHIKSKKLLVLYARSGSKYEYDNGDLKNDYIKALPFSVDDNTAMNCTHTQVHSSGNGFFRANNPYPEYLSWSYDLITFASGTKVNADLIPTDFRINLQITTCPTAGGTYEDMPTFTQNDLIRVIEIQPGFDSLVIPYNNTTAPAGLHTSFYNIINNKFTGVSELSGKRYMNYLIGADVDFVGTRPNFVQDNTFMATALLSTNQKRIDSSNSYSNVQITPNTLVLDISAKDNENRIFSSQSYLTPTNKYAKTFWSGADLTFFRDFDKQMIVDARNNLTSPQFGNIAFANQFSGDIETSKQDLYEFFKAFKSADLTSVPICNTIMSLMLNTLNLPFWKENNDIYCVNGWGIFNCSITSIFDPRFSSDIDPSDYRAGKDIYDTTNEIYIRFF